MSPVFSLIFGIILLILTWVVPPKSAIGFQNAWYKPYGMKVKTTNTKRFAFIYHFFGTVFGILFILLGLLGIFS